MTVVPPFDVRYALSTRRMQIRRLDEGHPKIMLQMQYDPEGAKESIGSFVGLDSRRVKGDLESFKDFIENRAHETGAWRGNIEEN